MFAFLLASAVFAGELPADATGRFVRAEAEADVRARLDAAVEAAAADVSVVVRPIARSMLTEQAQSCAGYTMRLDGDVFSVHCDGRTPIVVTLGRTATVDPNGDGDQVTCVAARDGRSVKLDFKTDRGGRRVTYTFAEDGALVVDQEVYSSYLETPMRWSVRYRKA